MEKARHCDIKGRWVLNEFAWRSELVHNHAPKGMQCSDQVWKYIDLLWNCSRVNHRGCFLLTLWWRMLTSLWGTWRWARQSARCFPSRCMLAAKLSTWSSSFLCCSNLQSRFSSHGTHSDETLLLIFNDMPLTAHNAYSYFYLYLHLAITLMNKDNKKKSKTQTMRSLNQIKFLALLHQQVIWR